MHAVIDGIIDVDSFLKFIRILPKILLWVLPDLAEEVLALLPTNPCVWPAVWI